MTWFGRYSWEKRQNKKGEIRKWESKNIYLKPQTPNEKEFLSKLLSLEQILLNLTNENIETSVDSSLCYYDNCFPETFFNIICSFLYSSYKIQNKELIIYINFLKIFGIKVKESHKNPKNIGIFEYLSQFLMKLNTNESNSLMEKLIEEQLIDPRVTKNSKTLYFAHNMLKYEILELINRPIRNYD